VADQHGPSRLDRPGPFSDLDPSVLASLRARDLRIDPDFTAVPSPSAYALVELEDEEDRAEASDARTRVPAVQPPAQDDLADVREELRLLRAVTENLGTTASLNAWQLEQVRNILGRATQSEPEERPRPVADAVPQGGDWAPPPANRYPPLGSGQRIIFDRCLEKLSNKERLPSVEALAKASGYGERHVHRILAEFRTAGILPPSMRSRQQPA